MLTFINARQCCSVRRTLPHNEALLSSAGLDVKKTQRLPFMMRCMLQGGGDETRSDGDGNIEPCIDCGVRRTDIYSETCTLRLRSICTEKRSQGSGYVIELAGGSEDAHDEVLQ